MAAVDAKIVSVQCVSGAGVQQPWLGWGALDEEIIVGFYVGEATGEGWTDA